MWAGLSLAVGIALVVGVLPAVADLSEVWRAITDMEVWEIAVLLVVAAWNILTYQFVMMAALPGLSLRHAFLVGQMSTAVANTIPAGAVAGVGVTYAMLHSYGHRAASIAVAALTTGVWNTFVKLGLPLIALVVLTVTGDASAPLVTATVFGMLILLAAVAGFALVLVSERLARRIGHLVGRGLSALRRLLRRDPVTTVGESFVRFRRQSIGLVRHRWLLITLTTLLSHMSLYVLLLLALRFVDVRPEAVTAAEILGAFAVVRLLTAVPITPGGLGVVELGLTAALVVAGGREPNVVAGVLVYRALSYAVQVPVGAVAFLLWRMETGGDARELAAEAAAESG